MCVCVAYINFMIAKSAVMRHCRPNSPHPANIS